jgi:hypothetical protein
MKDTRTQKSSKCKSCGRRFLLSRGELKLVATIAGGRLWCSRCRQDSIAFPLDVTCRESFKLIEGGRLPRTMKFCPIDVDTATGTFDPVGYDDPNMCAGCGTPYSEHTDQAGELRIPH